MIRQLNEFNVMSEILNGGIACLIAMQFHLLLDKERSSLSCT